KVESYMRKAIPLEQEILSSCLAILRLNQIVSWRCNSGAIAGTYRGKRRFVRFSTMPGLSDILGVLRPAGRLLAVEVKRPGQKPTPEQAAFLDLIRACGGLAIVVRSDRELEECLRREGVIR